MWVNVVGHEEKDGVKEPQVGCMEKCLSWWAEESLVHEFHVILNVWYGVDIADGVWWGWAKLWVLM